MLREGILPFFFFFFNMLHELSDLILYLLHSFVLETGALQA